MVKSIFLGLLGHHLEFIDQYLGIELARDLCAESVDCRRDLLVLWLLEKLAQGPGPIQPLGMDLDLLAVVGCDDVVHGPDVTAGIDPDGLS